MTKLALHGGPQAIRGWLTKFNTIGKEEKRAAVKAMSDGNPLSGYLGGVYRGGPYVQRLEELWAAKFGVKHAIACNSATSGLLAASVACDFHYPQGYIVSPYTMSATAAAPIATNAPPYFYDVEAETFCLDVTPKIFLDRPIIVTNLFGHPARLHNLRKICDKNGVHLIEDNAQAPLAMENGRYAGTIGHIGVFSLNVHKHIQCGEGGVCTTDDDELSRRLRAFINHGECFADNGGRTGLNLRLPEVSAAIAIEQLKKADDIVSGRIAQAEKLTAIAKQFKWLKPPVVREGCTHVFYVWAALLDSQMLGISRKTLVAALAAEGMPLVEGYVDPLYRLDAFKKYPALCPVAEELHDRSLLYLENCAWTLSDEQIEQFGEALLKIENNVDRLKDAA